MLTLYDNIYLSHARLDGDKMTARLRLEQTRKAAERVEVYQFPLPPHITFPG